MNCVTYIVGLSITIAHSHPVSAVFAEDQSLEQCRSVPDSSLIGGKLVVVVGYDALVLLILSQCDISWVMLWNEYIPFTAFFLADMSNLGKGIYIPFPFAIAIHSYLENIRFMKLFLSCYILSVLLFCPSLSYN